MLSSSVGSLYKKENGTRKIFHAVISPFLPSSPSIFTPAALYTNDKFSSTKIRN